MDSYTKWSGDGRMGSWVTSWGAQRHSGVMHTMKVTQHKTHDMNGEHVTISHMAALG